MELPKKFKCPNHSFPHSGEDKTVVEELWKQHSKQGAPPYPTEFVTIDNPLLKVFGVYVAVFLYDWCTECGTRFCRQIVPGTGNMTSRTKIPGIG
jgi:hypothetical protein